MHGVAVLGLGNVAGERHELRAKLAAEVLPAGAASPRSERLPRARTCSSTRRGPVRPQSCRSTFDMSGANPDVDVP